MQRAPGRISGLLPDVQYSSKTYLTITFGFCAQNHFLSRICSDMTVHYHVLLMLGFSARAGSCSARWDRAAVSMWLVAPRSLCMPLGGAFPQLQKQQDGCPTEPWRWEGPWWGPSFCTAAAPLCTELHCHSQKDEMALLPKLHLQRVDACCGCKTYSENFSIPLPQGHQQVVVVLLLGC